jgi:hypothetical protein
MEGTYNTQQQQNDKNWSIPTRRFFDPTLQRLGDEWHRDMLQGTKTSSSRSSTIRLRAEF